MSGAKLELDLQTRDLRLLRFVFSSRVATRDQIVRRHFGDRHLSTAEKRIARLTRAGLLKVGAMMRDGRMEKCFFPSALTVGKIAHLFSFRLDNPHIKSESPEHDIRLAELVMRLEKLGTFRSFFSENLLQSSSELTQDPILGDFVKIQSDGALALRNENGKQSVYAVEMEITPKAASRYRNKLISYYLSHCLDGVLYVCGSQEIVNLVTEADQAARAQRALILHTVLEENALRPGSPITFGDGKTQTLVLR